jgi:hypothetical protein
MRFSPALRDLDSMVVNIELTLTSIIQGVALTFLIENTRSLLSIHQAAAWLYALTGLCIIFIFWSRSILHTLTLIRWPIEFGHNFLYIASTLGECLLFTCLSNPLAWFEMSVLYGLTVWILFAYDIRMTRPREADLPSEASRRLSQLIERDSRLNVQLLMPVLIVFNGLCAVCVGQWPSWFLARQGHVWLILAQLLGLVFYLYYVMRFASRLAPLVATRQKEQRALAMSNQAEG